jgi:hypothetical protein
MCRNGSESRVGKVLQVLLVGSGTGASSKSSIGSYSGSLGAVVVVAVVDAKGTQSGAGGSFLFLASLMLWAMALEMTRPSF